MTERIEAEPEQNTIPLVGRNYEMEEAQRSLALALSGRGNLLFISGEAGIGKTRLLDELSRIARATGCQVLVGHCMPGSPFPYLPFKEALGNSEEEESRNQWLISEAPSRDRSLLGMLGLLRTISKDAPVLLALEDMQWSDESSVQLLHFLARNIKDVKVQIVATYRPEELAEINGAPHPLKDTLRLLVREGLSKDIRLEALGLGDVKTLTHSLLNGIVDEQVTNLIQNNSGGNPLFAIQLVDTLVADGSVHESEGVWELSKNKKTIPLTIKETVLRRLWHMPKEERILIQSASVMGRFFDPLILAEAIGSDLMATLESLDDIAESARIIEYDQDIFKFSNESVRSVIYADMPPPIKKAVHHQLASVLEGRGETVNPGELSYHFELGGDDRKCVTYSIEAGMLCYNMRAMAEARTYLERVERLADGSKNAQELYQARLAMVDVEKMLGHWKIANEDLERCLDMARSSDKARLLRLKAECWLIGYLGTDTATARSLLDEAESHALSNREEFAEIEYDRAQLDVIDGAQLKAEEHCKRALDIFRETNNQQGTARAITTLGSILISLNRVDEAIEELNAALELFKKYPDMVAALEARMYLGIANLIRGNLENCGQTYETCISEARQIGDYSNMRWGMFYLALCYQLGEKKDKAFEIARIARESSKTSESKTALAVHDVMLANLSLESGRLAEAGLFIEEATRLLKEFEGKHFMITSLAWAVGARVSAYEGQNGFEDAFRRSIAEMDSVQFGTFFKALTQMWFAECLANRGKNPEAAKEFTDARDSFLLFGNDAAAKAMEEARDQLQYE